MDYIADTIMKQIKGNVLQAKGFNFVRQSDAAMLVCKGDKSLCIRYNESSDLYDLSKSTARQHGNGKAEELKEVHCDQLVGIIAEFFNIEDKAYRESFGSPGDRGVETCVICGKPIRQGCATLVCGTDVNGLVHIQCLIPRLSK